MFTTLRLLLVASLFALTGCFGSYYEPEPVGIGKAADELKLSPCACLQLDLPQELPDWFVAVI